jgi:hypothetical protein
MTDRDRHILELIARYGLVTVDALKRIFDLTDKAVERVLTRLIAIGLLESTQLVGRRHYYTFTAAGARLIGLDEAASRPIGSQALLQNYAMLSHCVLGPDPTERMTRAEFVARFPTLAVAGAISSSRWTRYCLDASERCNGGSGMVRLALLLPTIGSNPRRIARKARREVEKRWRSSEAFAGLIRARLFSIIVLVEDDEKGRRVAAMLARDPWHSRAVVVSGYLDLVLSVGGRSRNDRSS